MFVGRDGVMVRRSVCPSRRAEKSISIFFRLKIGWEQFIQLVERKGAVPFAKLDCLSDDFRQFHLALPNLKFSLMGARIWASGGNAAADIKTGYWKELTTDTHSPNWSTVSPLDS